MGSDFSTVEIAQVASCSICQDLMSHPVSINCGHTYCKSCIQSYYNNVSPKKRVKKTLGCPLCRSPFSLETLRPNKELENIIDILKEMEEQDCEMLCKEHEEKLDIFCEDEGQLLCWRCYWDAQHKGHTLALVKDVHQEYTEKLQKCVTKLSELQENHKVQILAITCQINAWKDAIKDRKQTIQSNFKNLQRFLHEEEKFYLWRLENEEEQMLMRLRSKEASLQQKFEGMKCQIQELEAKCEGSAQKLLQDVKNTLSRCEAMKIETLTVEPLEIHTECNISELYLDVKTVLRRHQVSVILDPSTAHPDLALSKDRRQVTYKGCHKDLQTSAKRFSVLPCVLGCEGFTLGKYYFEVSVENASAWDVGVCRENVPRDFSMKKKPELGFWTIKMSEEDGLRALTSAPTPLLLSEKLQLVGVFLDYEAGAVSFYNVTAGSHIFTFPKACFISDTLRPFFQVYQHSPLFLPACQKESKK
ncbi:E3 ubiquitin-protein ligase TRIM38 [Meriones unguiculatus]|uniref:E3 ubiquitin-protein ligase TRIM38 n=1 Tax=Meriones unguiculatus TaxID=10047 RepID=UPI000B4E904A|nr:E3 ubiquitin-protein ligase TRIM38 [Meriones unguiculatus]